MRRSVAGNAKHTEEGSRYPSSCRPRSQSDLVIPFRHVLFRRHLLAVLRAVLPQKDCRGGLPRGELALPTDYNLDAVANRTQSALSLERKNQILHVIEEP